MSAHRVFLLSPASCAGKRAELLFNARSAFPLAQRLRSPEGAPLGDVFSFLSGLYFRGKLAYARAFARSTSDEAGVHVITTSRGLVLPEVPVGIDDLREFAATPLEPGDRRYAEPFARTARALDERIGGAADVVLLGSVASEKYVGVLGGIFGHRLRFPAEFVGRGDMSRGGLLLRSVSEGRELDYIPVAGARRRGSRPPRLEPIRARR
jgi:hypothetical protein